MACSSIDVGTADTRTVVCLLPQGMERGQAPVATPEEATPDQQAHPLHRLTLDTPDRRPRGPVRYPLARAARGIGVPGVFMRMR
jgi:hypothetical protein